MPIIAWWSFISSSLLYVYYTVILWDKNEMLITNSIYFVVLKGCEKKEWTNSTGNIPSCGDVPCVIKWNVFGEVKWNEVSDKMKYNHLAIKIIILHWLDFDLLYWMNFTCKAFRNFVRKPNEDFPKLIKVFSVFSVVWLLDGILVFWVKICHEIMNILRLRFSHEQFRIWTVM